MRANINLIPRTDVDYDIWAPMALGVKPSPDPTINAVEKECLELFESVNKDEVIEIYNNGEPPAWGERVAGILKKHGYTDVSVDAGQDYDYLSLNDPLFPDLQKPYDFLDIGDLKYSIEQIFDFYKGRQWTIEEPTSGVCGHYYRGRMLWTQVQPGYDCSSSNNSELMQMLMQLLPATTQMLEQHFANKGVIIPELEQRITLRLLDYVNQNDLNSKLASHLDASLFTGLLYHDAPSLHAVEFLDDSLTLAQSQRIDISDRLSQGQGLWIPGYIYADEMKSYVSPCWHGVQVPDNCPRRLSMVVRVEGELVHRGTQIKIPGYYWNDEFKTWSKNQYVEADFR